MCIVCVIAFLELKVTDMLFVFVMPYGRSSCMGMLYALANHTSTKFRLPLGHGHYSISCQYIKKTFWQLLNEYLST